MPLKINEPLLKFTWISLDQLLYCLEMKMFQIIKIAYFYVFPPIIFKNLHKNYRLALRLKIQCHLIFQSQQSKCVISMNDFCKNNFHYRNAISRFLLYEGRGLPYTPQKCCISDSVILREWMKYKNRSMGFAVSIIFRNLSFHKDDFTFFLSPFIKLDCQWKMISSLLLFDLFRI